MQQLIKSIRKIRNQHPGMKQRNYSIDILKFVCACIVVTAHTAFKWHDTIMPLARCAVPCFFMISGFLLYSNKGIGKERLKRNINHIGHVLLWSTMLFIAYKEIASVVHGEFFVPSMEQWMYFIVLNENPFVCHLWYLGAYLYALLIMLAVDRYNLWRPATWAAPLLLLLGNLIIIKHSALIWDYPFVYRNFLFLGVPYFTIGAWCKKNAGKLLAVNKGVWGAGTVLFAVTTMVEENIILNLGMPPTREHYLSTPFLAICLFLFVLSFKAARSSHISRTGEKYSLYIYVLHPLFTLTLPAAVYRMPDIIDRYYQYTAPLVALALTIAFVYVLRKTKIIA